MHDKNWKANEKWYRKKKYKQYILSSHKLFLTCAVVSRSRNSMAINNKMLAKKEYKKTQTNSKRNEMKKNEQKNVLSSFPFRFPFSWLFIFRYIISVCVYVYIEYICNFFLLLRQKITYNDRRAHLSIDGLWLQCTLNLLRSNNHSERTMCGM